MVQPLMLGPLHPCIRSPGTPGAPKTGCCDPDRASARNLIEPGGETADYSRAGRFGEEPGVPQPRGQGRPVQGGAGTLIGRLRRKG